jgi:multidrug resistance efflux pump
MELIITALYGFIIWLIFKKFKLLKMNAFWGIGLAGIWVAAIALEILTLMQFTPSGNAVVEAYVVELAPSRGGQVEAVYAKSNEPLKKGTPIFQMNQTLLKDELEEANADLSSAQDWYDDIAKAVKKSAVAEITFEKAKNSLVYAKAEQEAAAYHLEQTTVLAPSDGYAVNLQLHPGSTIRIKEKVISFVSTEEYWIVLKIPQFQAKRIQQGDAAEFRLDLYPGRVFSTEVASMVWAAGEAQTGATGTIPSLTQSIRPDFVAVRLKVTDHPDQWPLRYGAAGKVAVYTQGAPDILITLRKLILRMESWVAYLGLS